MYRYLLAHLFSNLSRISRRAAMQSAGIIFVATVISGCGNKGDLYLPEDVSTTYQTSGSSAQSD
jgi:predicted small lipoprotein YifL